MTHPHNKPESKYERAHCIRGCRVFQEIWDTAVGEVFAMRYRFEEPIDGYTVTVKKDGMIIRHYHMLGTHSQLSSCGVLAGGVAALLPSSHPADRIHGGCTMENIDIVVILVLF